MADQLKLDIIVDDHGAVQTLGNVDAGVKKVIGTAAQGSAATAQLSNNFGGLALSAGRLIGITSGVAAFFQVVSTFRDIAEDASRFADVAERLEVSASKFQQVATAAADFGISSEQLAGSIGRLQARIGSGQIDKDLERIGINLQRITDADGIGQLKLVAGAIGDIEDPSRRAAEAVAVLGRDGEAMRGILTKAFVESADAADAMSDRTIKRLDEMSEAFGRFKTSSKSFLGEVAVAFADLMTGRAGEGTGDLSLRDILSGNPGGGPNVKSPGGGPGPLPTVADNKGETDRVALLLEQAAKAKMNAELERRGDVEAAMEMVRLYGTELPEKIEFVSVALQQIEEAQKIITKSGGDWADTLNTRVAIAVDAINAKYVQAVMLNTQLAGGAKSERDRLMEQLTATVNPNEGGFDKRFNQIDQEAKFKLSMVDQADRESAADAENAILEEMNLKVQQLQQNWEGVVKKTDDAATRTQLLNQSYTQLSQPFGGQVGGGRLSNGLTAPTGEQVATGRYFGPVTPNGTPDLARLGGGVTQNTYHIDASGSVFESTQDFVRRIEQGLAERERDQGTRARR